jgi:integrase
MQGPRRLNKLTALDVASKSEPGRYSDGGGLELQVSKWGSKSWVFRFARNGKTRWLGLGPIHTVTLAEARVRSRHARQLLLDGKDPIVVKDEARAAEKVDSLKAVTFKQCAEDFLYKRLADFRNEKHKAQWRSTLEAYAFPKLGDLPVRMIDPALVLQVLRPLEDRAETWQRVRGRIERIIEYGRPLGYTSGENPAALKALKDHAPRKPEVKHHKAVSYQDLPAFMSDLRERGGISARALEFCILTASRPGEVAGARWEEIDANAKAWIVPGSRMKSKRQHVVALSDRALEIIDQLPRDSSGYLFPGAREGKPISDMAMLELIRGMKGNGFTVHGTARASFNTWSKECTNFDNVTRGAALAHTEEKLEEAYTREDGKRMFSKRARLMSAWADYLTKPIGSAANVKAIRA